MNKYLRDGLIVGVITSIIGAAILFGVGRDSSLAIIGMLPLALGLFVQFILVAIFGVLGTFLPVGVQVANLFGGSTAVVIINLLSWVLLYAAIGSSKKRSTSI